MASTNSSQNNSLPEELELALRQATSSALVALNSLRFAVRDHVQNECSRGSSQNEIDDGLRSMISSCGPALGNIDYSAERAKEVTMQVLKWSSSFYQRAGRGTGEAT